MNNHRYDNSQVSTYQKCPFSYYLQYIKGIRKSVQDDTNSAMNFGDYAHRFWDEFYLSTGKTFEEIVSSYESDPEAPQFSKQALEFFCKSYDRKYREDDKKFQIKEVESASEFPLGNYRFIVKKDGAFELQGNIFGLEHKTTQSISYNYFDKYFLNSQMTAQCYDTTLKYGQCSGILLNVGEIKLLKKKPTSDYDGVLLTTDGYISCRFVRNFINRTPQEIEDWKQNTILWIEAIEESQIVNDWKKATGSWGGAICSKCTYKELCKTSVGMELDENILDVLYEKCDPYEYLQKNIG